MFTEYPIIHTNMWDAIWAVPVVLLVVLTAKWLFGVLYSIKQSYLAYRAS